MKDLSLTRLAQVLIVLILFSFLLPGSGRSAHAAVTTTLPESNDFATRVLRDPWDMSEFTDVSIALNNSGQINYLQNYKVQNGIFSAGSTSLADAQFSLLFPGYRISQNVNSINAGKYGVNYPITASTYHCLYVAMQVNSTSPDYYQIFWFADTHLNEGPSPWGYTNNIPLSPGIWKLYGVDLSQPGNFGGGTPWNGNATWQGLQFHPSTKPNINFATDWVRLTDCSSVNTTVTWNAGTGNALWLTSADTGNKILVQTGINGSTGSATLDTQGLAAGTYTVGLGDSQNCCSQTGSTITINPAPIATFSRPSPTSGVDYATQAGNPWDFSDPSDTIQIARTNAWYGNGYLNVSTPSAPLPTGADPVIYLNVPQPINNVSAYRYLSYRIYTQWPLQQVPYGTIVRWIWGVPPGCDLVSKDIPLDVGWQTYTVDLSDPNNGAVVQMGGSGCPAPGITWATTPSIFRLRFKPNENALGQDLFQQIDWIRLTQVDQVARGTPYSIQITMNKPPAGVSLNYYYTTDRQQPTQHAALPYTVSAPPPAGQFRLFLPMIFRDISMSVPNSVNYLWDTSGVTPGQYYVCVVSNDGYNTTTFCSDAPLNVL